MFTVIDWSGKDVFKGKVFPSFDDAYAFLSQHIDNTYGELPDSQFDTEIGEYYIYKL